MLFFFTTQPLWASAAILVGLTTVLAMLGPSLVRRYVALERLTTNNEIAGFKFATVGVLYAVLLAFAIIMVWQKFSDAETTVAQEASAAETIYRLSRGAGDKAGSELRGALTAYLAVAVADDWPAMDRGMTGGSRSARQALDAVYTALLTPELSQRGTAPLVSEILHQLDVITQARRVRLVAAEGAVPGVVWLVLFGGAILTVIFTFFFGTQSLRAQTMMTGLLSLLIFSELLIIVLIDRPFSGAVKVEPQALAEVLADFRPAAGTAPSPTQQH
jgi:Protein of unknown function (DUF4239)